MRRQQLWCRTWTPDVGRSTWCNTPSRFKVFDLFFDSSVYTEVKLKVATLFFLGFLRNAEKLTLVCTLFFNILSFRRELEDKFWFPVIFSSPHYSTVLNSTSFLAGLKYLHLAWRNVWDVSFGWLLSRVQNIPWTPGAALMRLTLASAPLKPPLTRDGFISPSSVTTWIFMSCERSSLHFLIKLQQQFTQIWPTIP